MRMSSLVDSTYRAITGRFKRGGTVVKSATRPEPLNYRWGCRVVLPPSGVSVLVEVRLLTENVYKNDKVQVVVSDILGTVPYRSFDPVSGNCPPVDAVEAFVRFALAEKAARPAPKPAPVIPKPRSKKGATTEDGV